MNQKLIVKFFRLLSQNVKGITKAKVQIILTGAAAGILMGGNRPSIDIDFAIICDKRKLEDIEESIRHVSHLTGIAVNFSEDIDRWSQITFLDYKHHTTAYRTFGIIEVSILSPAYWSIGKITRYLDPDVDDLIKVLKHNRVLPEELVRLWGRALRKSLRSTASFTFKKHVEHFLKTYGLTIWGEGFDKDKCLDIFQKACSKK